MRFQAVIFDMDGVLTDTEPVHYQATNRALAAEGFALTWEEYLPSIGRDEASAWELLRRRFPLRCSRRELSRRYNAEVLSLLRQGVKPLPGALEALAKASDLGLRLALATSSTREWTKATLRGLGLDGAFEVMVTGDLVREGKPAPEIYFLAAERLGLPPQACLVLEDSPPGVAAAQAAGMTVVGVRSPSAPDADLSTAHLVVDSLADVDLEGLLQTLEKKISEGEGDTHG